MSLRKETAAILEKNGLVLTKLRGQHFLIDDRVLTKIVAAAGVGKGDRVLEIGAGVGTLTAALIAAGVELTALEFDARFIGVLRERFQAAAHCTMIEQDALVFCDDLRAWGKGRPYQVVANLPYGITTPLLWQLLGVEQACPPETLTIMVQAEVAERMVATPGEMNMLGVLVQSFGTAEISFLVPASAFLPPPKVESAVVRIVRHAKNTDRRRLLSLAKAGFSAPRKKLAGNVAAVMHRERREVVALLEQAGISANARAETLAVDDWRRLAAVFV